jgi:TolB protein
MQVTEAEERTRARRGAILRRVVPVLFAIGVVTALAPLPAIAQTPGGTPLPTVSAPTGGAVTQIVVNGGNQALFKIALPPIVGDASVSETAVETASRDFTLSSLFQVLDPKSFTANLAAEGTGIDPASWRNVGAEGVVKGSSTSRGSGLHLELRLFVVSRGPDAVLKKEYDVPAGGVRGAMHQFDNEVVKWFTGTLGSFGSRMVFSATTGKGQKGIFSIDSDGQGLSRLTAVSNVALAPAIGPGGVYYSAGLPDGSYSLFKVGNPAAVLQRAGLIFGVAFGAGKMALVVSQGGASDIYVGSPDGAGLTKVTQGGLNTHPAFGPGGQLAYVSNSGGNPQIYVDGKRVSWRGTYNMAPAWCNDPEGTKLLFMGRDGATWDVFSVDPGGAAASMKRLTQDQGSNTYPACSPDGRSVAFFSTRGGLFLSNNQGMNQQKIAGVTGESLRWEN